MGEADMAAVARSGSPSQSYGNLFSHVGILQTPHGDAFVEPENPRVLSVLSSLLERMVAANDAYIAHFGHAVDPLHRLTVFHGLRAPSISVQKYVERIFKYANCSPSCFVVAFVYLDRFIHQQPGLPISSLNVHRLLITSVMAAAKFLDDAYYNNAYYAKVGGVSTEEMNRLELEFLFRIGFRLHVTVEVFNNYSLYLEREVAELNAYNSLKPLQLKHCTMGAGHMVEEEQQSNVYAAVKIMEPVS